MKSRTTVNVKVCLEQKLTILVEQKLTILVKLPGGETFSLCDTRKGVKGKKTHTTVWSHPRIWAQSRPL